MIQQEFRCSACKGTGLLNVEIEVQGHADTADRRWRQAAEAVLGAVKVQGEPALDYIAKVVAFGEKVSGGRP